MPAPAWIVAAVVSLALSGVPTAQANSKWQVLRDPSGSYAVQYPTTLRVSIPKGQGCTNGACRSTERVDLNGAEGSIALIIQRDINPRRLPVQAWYESLANRPLNSATETIVTVGGRDAVRRSGLVPAETVHLVNGKEVSRSSTLRRDDSVFVPLGPTDILTIVIHPKGQSGGATLKRVIETLKFGPTRR